MEDMYQDMDGMHGEMMYGEEMMGSDDEYGIEGY